MSDLHPCPSCRRHVAESVCRFCGHAVEHAPHTLPTGRMSRAAVFASALALGACSGGTKPAQEPRQPQGLQEPQPTPEIERSKEVEPPKEVEQPKEVEPQPDPLQQTQQEPEKAMPDRDLNRRRSRPCVVRDPARVAALQKQLAAAKTAAKKREIESQLQAARTPICAPYGAPPARRRSV